MSFILDIATANPAHQYSQDDFVRFYQNYTDDRNTQRKISLIARKSGIENRYSVLSDFGADVDGLSFFNKNPDSQIPSTQARMQAYRREALPLALAAAKSLKHFAALKDKITHLITVSCTGMYAPGLEIEMIEALELPPNTHRLAVNFMGCNAAILALKQAHYICQSEPTATVLVVCVEICTWHFQQNFDDDHLLANLLFADGAAAVLMSKEKPDFIQQNPLPNIKYLASELLHQGKNEMAWQIVDTGFDMNLTSYVSGLINGAIPHFLNKMKIDNATTQWLIHPGGKRILDDFAKTVSCTIDDLEASYAVLRDYGNMSSPTILYVLKYWLENRAKLNDTALLAAFGPGLSIETAFLV